jgi:hypothetical protein
MYDNGRCHFYIDEPAQTDVGTLVIPLRWLQDHEGKVWAEAWPIQINHNVSQFLTSQLQVKANY